MSRVTDSDALLAQERAVPAQKVDPVIAGTCLGIVSAVSYTGANTALRSLAESGGLGWALWVSCLKAVPAALVAWLLIAGHWRRGRKVMPDRRTIRALIAMGLFMQFGGNGMFQWALGHVGLAVTVPLTFATLISSGAFFGRVYLGEPIHPRTAVAMLILLVAIVLLSAGAENATAHLAGASRGTVAAAIAAACVSGIGFGTSGVLIRHCVTKDVTLAATIAILCTSGFVGLGIASLALMGPAEIASRTAADFPELLAAGCLNAAAFFAVSEALRRIPVTRVNLLNASQTAMCALVGIAWFDERLTAGIAVGIVLTIVGLLSLGNGRRRVASAPRTQAVGEESVSR